MYNKSTNKKDVTAHDIDQLKFWANVDLGAGDECWEWQGGRNTTGYGLFGVKSLPEDYEITGRMRTKLLAHRVAFSLDRGLRPEDYVMHTCDNKKCCNPNHLRVGTQQDNVDDMINKGRGFWQNTLTEENA